MFIPIAAAAIGLWFGSRKKPNTKFQLRDCIGPRSGVTWKVDDFTSAGVLVVKGNGAIGTFTRREDAPGFVYLRGTGNRESIGWMIRDFQSPKPKPPSPPSF